MYFSGKNIAKQALDKYLVDTKKPQGRPRTTWCRTIVNEFKNNSGLDINFESERSFFKDKENISKKQKYVENLSNAHIAA